MGTKSQYKNIEHNGCKKGLNIIGTTEITNHFRFLYDEYEKVTEDSVKLSSHQVMSFIDKLVEYDTNRGVNLTFVILDNARIHRSHEVREYIKKYEKRLFLIFQPTYSPQLNPQENMWNWMKKYLADSKAFANIQALSEKIAEFQKVVCGNIGLVKRRVMARNYYK